MNHRSCPVCHAPMAWDEISNVHTCLTCGHSTGGGSGSVAAYWKRQGLIILAFVIALAPSAYVLFTRARVTDVLVAAAAVSSVVGGIIVAQTMSKSRALRILAGFGFAVALFCANAFVGFFAGCMSMFRS